MLHEPQLVDDGFSFKAQHGYHGSIEVYDVDADGAYIGCIVVKVVAGEGRRVIHFLPQEERMRKAAAVFCAKHLAVSPSAK